MKKYHLLVNFLRFFKSIIFDKDIQKALNTFCEYQSTLNYAGEHPLNHDVAILVSQIDFCSEDDLQCESLGLSKLGGMCDPDTSCNVNQNTGFSLAFTIAHETAHKLEALKKLTTYLSSITFLFLKFENKA